MKERKGKKSKIFLLWSLLGPGLLAALADNDAGGVISYAVAKITDWILSPCHAMLNLYHLYCAGNGHASGRGIQKGI